MAFPIGLAISIGSSLLGNKGKDEQPPSFSPPQFQHHRGGWGMDNPIASAFNSAMGVTPLRAAADDILRRNKDVEAPSGGAPAPAGTTVGGQTSMWNQVKSDVVSSLISSLFSPRQQPQGPQFMPPTFGSGGWR